MPRAGRSPEPEEVRPGRSARIGRWLGPALFAGVLVLPAPPGLEPEGWRVAAVALLMAAWWITEAAPLAVTALLPLILLPMLGVAGMERAAAPFANPVIFLFMGGFMLGQAMQRWDLHRRIAFGILGRVGGSPRSLVAGFMAATAFLSMWVSNTAVAVMMLPVGVSVIQAVGRGTGEGAVPPGDPDFARALLLGIAYAASVGGMATLIGTPPNALLAGFVADRYGIVLGFGEWMLIGLPLALLTLPLVWFVLVRVAFRPDPHGRQLPSDVLRTLREGLGAMRPAERRVAWVFGATAAFWIARPLLERVVPGISDAGIAMGATLALFVLPAGRAGGQALLNWDWARRIPWDILLLFGGGLSLAAAISDTGLAQWIGGGVGGLGRLPVPLLLLAVVALLVFLTELTSNTASTAAFLPVLAAVAVSLGEPVLLLLVPATLAASCAFMLPVATPPNAIVFGSRWIEIRHMVRAGLFLNTLFILILPFLTLVLLRLFFGVEPGIPSPWTGG